MSCYRFLLYQNHIFWCFLKFSALVLRGLQASNTYLDHQVVDFLNDLLLWPSLELLKKLVKRVLRPHLSLVSKALANLAGRLSREHESACIRCGIAWCTNCHACLRVLVLTLSFLMLLSTQCYCKVRIMTSMKQCRFSPLDINS